MFSNFSLKKFRFFICLLMALGVNLITNHTALAVVIDVNTSLFFRSNLENGVVTPPEFVNPIRSFSDTLKFEYIPHTPTGVPNTSIVDNIGIISIPAPIQSTIGLFESEILAINPNSTPLSTDNFISFREITSTFNNISSSTRLITIQQRSASFETIQNSSGQTVERLFSYQRTYNLFDNQPNIDLTSLAIDGLSELEFNDIIDNLIRDIPLGRGNINYSEIGNIVIFDVGTSDAFGNFPISATPISIERQLAFGGDVTVLSATRVSEPQCTLLILLVMVILLLYKKSRIIAKSGASAGGMG